MGPSLPAEEPRSLSLTPKGEVVLAARSAVRLGPKEIKSFAVPQEKGVPEQLEGIAAALVTPGGSILVADEKKSRIYRYDRQYQYLGMFPDAKERKITRMILDGEGGIVCLDRDERTIRVYDESGRLLRALGGKGSGLELRKPVDVAVDPSRNLYVADEESGVLVFSPQGKLLATLSGESVRRPRAVTLDPAGAVLVYDEKTEKIVRFK
jgi:sugar lactone lactonase YvrE